MVRTLPVVSRAPTTAMAGCPLATGTPKPNRPQGAKIHNGAYPLGAVAQLQVSDATKCDAERMTKETGHLIQNPRRGFLAGCLACGISCAFAESAAEGSNGGAAYDRCGIFLHQGRRAIRAFPQYLEFWRIAFSLWSIGKMGGSRSLRLKE